jgi:hypothetical protein
VPKLIDLTLTTFHSLEPADERTRKISRLRTDGAQWLSLTSLGATRQRHAGVVDRRERAKETSSTFDRWETSSIDRTYTTYNTTMNSTNNPLAGLAPSNSHPLPYKKRACINCHDAKVIASYLDAFCLPFCLKRRCGPTISLGIFSSTFTLTSCRSDVFSLTVSPNVIDA